ncbi:MAG TPA: glycosyltransferase [Phnomibacter sp.]|nr:glycosyltransferase [Phnomibacter sp.]
MEILSNRNIVILSLKPWDSEIGSSSKQYAKLFAKEHKVLFINRFIDRMSLIKYRNDPKIKTRNKSRKFGIGRLEEAESNLWVLNPTRVLESINKIGIPFLYDRLNKINGRRIAAEIREVCKEIGFESFVLFIENDFIRGQYLPDLLTESQLNIYYIRDYLPSQSYFKPHGKRIEPLLMRNADIVFSNSPQLRDYALQHNPKSFFLGQGCDFSIFKEEAFPRPKALENIYTPIVGYAGTITNTRLDEALILYAAQQFPQWTFVLVGRALPDFFNSPLHAQPNVVFTGRVKLEEVAMYVSHFDVCINPQVRNSMTDGNYPLKIDEYLAYGKPVVALKTAAMQEIFSDYVHLADDAASFAKLIEAAYLEKDNVALQEARRKFARGHTWQACFENMERFLRESDTIAAKLKAV